MMERSAVSLIYPNNCLEGSSDDCTLWVGGLSSEVNEELLYELFLQAGPLVNVSIAKDRDGNAKPFGFVEFCHPMSVPYARNVMNHIELCGRPIKCDFKSNSCHAQGFRMETHPECVPQPFKGTRQLENEEKMKNGQTSFEQVPPNIRTQSQISGQQSSFNSPANIAGFSHVYGNMSVPGVGPVGMMDNLGIARAAQIPAQLSQLLDIQKQRMADDLQRRLMTMPSHQQAQFGGGSSNQLLLQQQRQFLTMQQQPRQQQPQQQQPQQQHFGDNRTPYYNNSRDIQPGGRQSRPMDRDWRVGGQQGRSRSPHYNSNSGRDRPYHGYHRQQ